MHAGRGDLSVVCPGGLDRGPGVARFLLEGSPQGETLTVTSPQGHFCASLIADEDSCNLRPQGVAWF